MLTNCLHVLHVNNPKKVYGTIHVCKQIVSLYVNKVCCESWFVTSTAFK